MIWSLILSFLSNLVGPVFNFLNTKVTADERMHIIDTKTMGTIATGGLAATQKADELNAQIRTSQSEWGPMTIMMAIILIPFVWHEWQVVMDSCRWLPEWVGWYPTIAKHEVGSWKVAALPDQWAAVELAIFQSFFIGASAAVGVIAAIKAIKR